MLRLRIKQSEPGQDLPRASDSAVQDGLRHAEALRELPSIPANCRERLVPRTAAKYHTRGLARFHRHPSRGLHCPVRFLAAVPAPCLRSTLVPAGSSPSCRELLAIPSSHPRTSTGSTSPQSVPVTGTLFEVPSV